MIDTSYNSYAPYLTLTQDAPTPGTTAASAPLTGATLPMSTPSSASSSSSDTGMALTTQDNSVASSTFEAALLAALRYAFGATSTGGTSLPTNTSGDPPSTVDGSTTAGGQSSGVSTNPIGTQATGSTNIRGNQPTVGATNAGNAGRERPNTGAGSLGTQTTDAGSLGTQSTSDAGSQGTPSSTSSTTGSSAGSAGIALPFPNVAGQSGGASTRTTAGVAPSTTSTAVGSADSTADGYTVAQCVSDMERVQDNDKREGGQPKTPQQLLPIAQGIIAGVNKYFPASQYGSPSHMAQTLIASAWKESKFDVTLGNGGVFQCASNRLADYNQAHGTHLQEGDLSSGNTAQAVDVSLWAMSHPNLNIVGKGVGGCGIPSDPAEAALYYWNYNAGQINDYISKTTYFISLMQPPT